MLNKLSHPPPRQLLTNQKQKSIQGGLACWPNGYCPAGTYCATSGLFEGLCSRN